jgi:hypothetical protein
MVQTNVNEKTLLGEYAAIPGAWWKILAVITLLIFITWRFTTVLSLVSSGDFAILPMHDKLFTVAVTLIGFIILAFAILETINWIPKWYQRNVRGWYFIIWLNEQSELQNKVVWCKPDWGDNEDEIILVFKLGGWFKKPFVVSKNHYFKLSRLTNKQIREELLWFNQIYIKDLDGTKTRYHIKTVFQLFAHLQNRRHWSTWFYFFEGFLKNEEQKITYEEIILETIKKLSNNGGRNPSRREASIRSYLCKELLENNTSRHRYDYLKNKIQEASVVIKTKTANKVSENQ